VSICFIRTEDKRANGGGKNSLLGAFQEFQLAYSLRRKWLVHVAFCTEKC